MKRTTFLIICALLFFTASAQSNKPLEKMKEVYHDENVTFRKIDRHTWVGTGNLVYNESMYLIEGKKKAVLIDAGTNIPRLDTIVSNITDKKVTLLLTHVHGDHTGGARYFDEVWINPADTVNIQRHMPDYQGKINFLEHGQIIDLGGRKLEVFFTPGHTPGSTTFLEVGEKTGFSGDAFGNGNLLVFCDFKTLQNTCKTSLEYFSDNGYKKFYNGHFNGNNFETLKRISELQQISTEVLAGNLEGEAVEGGTGLNRVISRDGIKVNYNNRALEKELFLLRHDIVEPNEFNENIFKLVGDDWTVITAGEDPNSMVASWGGVGIMFNKPVTWCFLRANRYTLEKIRETGTYTMCYFPKEFKEEILKFGIASGRYSDKMEKTALTPVMTPDDIPAYHEAKIIIECRLIAAPTVSKDEFYTEEAKEFLQGGYDEAKDWHKLVYGEITNIYVKR